MDTGSWLGLGGLMLCLVLVVLSSIAETTLVPTTLGRWRYPEEDRLTRSQAIRGLLNNPGILQAVLALLRITGLVGATALITAVAVQLYGSAWTTLLGSLGLSVVVLLFLQVTAAYVARHRPQAAVRVIANRVSLPPLAAVAWLLLKVSGRETESRPGEAHEELRALLEAADEDSGLEEEEKAMLRGVFELGATTAREIMVPRLDIVAVATGTPPAEVAQLAVSKGFSRIPLYEENIDQIIGIIYAKDLLAELTNGTVSRSLREIARPPHFIPESKRISDLLREFQQQRVHMAIVVDEYGGTAGLVTIEDLLEEIVGEIEDEYDASEAQVVLVSESEALLDGRTSIDQLNEIFHLNVEGEDFDTVGGLVYSALGHIPTEGEVVEVEGLRLSVLSTVGRRVGKVRAVRLDEDVGAEDTQNQTESRSSA